MNVLKKIRLSLVQTVLVAAVAAGISAPAQAMECADLWQWLNSSCRKLADTFNNGTNGVLVSGYAWHIPSTWTPEARAQENPYAYGLGWSRTVEQANGDADTVYFMAFDDSHSEVQYNLGYAWATYWGPREYPQPGLGYTLAIIQRPDIASGWPFPAVLPLFNLRYREATLLSTYIPKFNSGINHGSVLFIFGQFNFN